MNLTEVRQDLLEQLQARVPNGISEGMALRYCLAVGASQRVVDVAELTESVPWSWNLCIAASGDGANEAASGDGANESEPSIDCARAWEVLEFLGEPDEALHVVEVLRDLLREEWQVGEGRLECAVQGETGWNGHQEQLAGSLLLVTGGGDLRFEGAERASAGKIRLHVVEESAGDATRKLRIQLDPHELFAHVLAFEHECELEPLSRTFDVAEEFGVEIDGDQRAQWSSRLRFWAHGMNLMELEDRGSHLDDTADLHAETGEESVHASNHVLREMLNRIEIGARELIAANSLQASSEALANETLTTAAEERGATAADEKEPIDESLSRWLDAVRAIEDELCAVLLAMPETTAEAEMLAVEDNEEDAAVEARRRKAMERAANTKREAEGDGLVHTEAEAEALALDANPSAAEIAIVDASAGNKNAAQVGFEVDAKPEELFASDSSPTAAELELMPVSAASARDVEPTAFVGDDQDACEAKVLELFDAEGSPVGRLNAGELGWFAVNRSCFFAYGAGVQVDRGLAVWGEGRGRVLDVRCVQDVILHALQLDHGFLRPGGSIDLLLDRRRRREVERQASAAAAAAGVLDRWVREAQDGGSRRGARIAEHRVEVLELKAGIDGFNLGLKIPASATRGWGSPEAWRDRLEQELGEWTLDAWWIDPSGTVEDTREALSMAVADRSSFRNTDRGARRVLSLGPLGWIRTDAIGVPNSAHVGLVLLATPDRLYEDAWTVRGVAGKRALALARKEVHLVEDAAGEVVLIPRPPSGTAASSKQLRVLGEGSGLGGSARGPAADIDGADVEDPEFALRT